MDGRDKGFSYAVGCLKELLQPYIWICLSLLIAFQLLAFYGTRPALPFLTARSLRLPLDDMIPFIPEWVIVYCLAYVSWLVSALVILAQGKAHAFRFTGAFIIAMFLSAAVFLIWPLRIARPQIVGDGFLRDLLRMIYRADEPVNLCPSLHVLVSYFCWRGLWGCPRLPRVLSAINLIFLVLVCLSILFVKQHYSIDIAGGILIGETALQTARLLRPERLIRPARSD